ncbi:MAG: hypothetical protein JNM76_06360 [Betaproteobacteria bacterium]|nr:hypothetical protein [Betaproteobacteria bacterium]
MWHDSAVQSSGARTFRFRAMGVWMIGAIALLLCATRPAAAALLSAPANGATVVNGVTFAGTPPANTQRIELTANGFAFGTLNAANSWSTRYTFTTIGQRALVATAYDAGGATLATQNLTVTIVEVRLLDIAASSNFLNGTPVAIAAGPAATRVVLKAETFEIGRSDSRDISGEFDVTPAIMGTLGSRTLVAEAYNAAGTLLGSHSVPVSVVNVDFVTPPTGAHFTSGAEITAQVQAVAGTARVDYLVDNVMIGSATDATSQFRRMFTLVNSGTRNLKAIAYTGGGAKLGEDASSIVIDAVSCTPPKVLQNGQCVDPPPATCQFGAWTSYKGVALRRHASGAYLYKTANKHIDADGAPNAYHPADVGKPCSASAGLKGLDCPANAGYPSTSWWPSVLAVDPANTSKPYVQKTGAYAGYFVSMTSLFDASKASTDPARYVSSTAFPYIVFPGNFYAMSGTGKRGDLGYAINLGNNKKSHFVVAETGPANADLGEMSIQLATAMGGTNPNPINGAGAPSGTILYVSFPNSTSTYPWPMSNAQMAANAQQLLAGVGGEAGILACKDL